MLATGSTMAQNPVASAVQNNDATYSFGPVCSTNKRIILLSLKAPPPPSPPKEQKKKYCVKKYSCFQCKKKFTMSTGLNRHLRTVHKITVPLITNIKCVDCPESKCFSSLKSLREHLVSNHNYTMEEERLVFSTMNEFLSWKKIMEKETSTSYIKQRGSKRRHSSNIHFFMCHRSGHYFASGTGRRNLKTKGSCKIGFSCTSTITAVESRHQIIVDFVKEHYMHSNDVSHLRLSREEKYIIAAKLQAGVSYDDILSEFHNNDKERSSKKSRMLTRKDIHNIKSNIDSITDFSANNMDSMNLFEDAESFNIDDDLSSRDNENSNVKPPDLLSQLSQTVFDGIDNLPVRTDAEKYIDQALEKLKTLRDTLIDNKKDYDETLSQTILKKLDHVLEISISKTLSIESPVVELPIVQLTQNQKPQSILILKPPVNQKLRFILPANSSNTKSNILANTNSDHCY